MFVTVVPKYDDYDTIFSFEYWTDAEPYEGLQN